MRTPYLYFNSLLSFFSFTCFGCFSVSWKQFFLNRSVAFGIYLEPIVKQLHCYRERGSAKRLSDKECEVVIDEAIRRILGLAAPTYSFNSFDQDSQKCSLIVDTRDLHLIWAALSVYGSHYGLPVAFHLNSVGFVNWVVLVSSLS